MRATWLVLAVLACGCGQDAERGAGGGGPPGDAVPPDGHAGDAVAPDTARDGAPGPEPCAGEGTVVEVDGIAYCAHHDVARFTCPPALPVRRAFRGVALCSDAPLDDIAARAVAEAALRTGRVLEARTILRLTVPDEWRSAPGAPAGRQIPIQVATETPSNVSWATPDGAPFLCERAFDRFEVEPDGQRLRVTAWDRLRCAPDVIGYGLVEEEALPLELPPQAPGRRTLSAMDGAVVAPLVVDLAAACPDRKPAAECFRGAWFAECGGAGAPGLWCHADGGVRCLWADCPPLDYDRAVECGAELYCPTPHMAYGPEPWDRDRAMDLAVRVDGTLGPEAAAVTCAAESDLRMLAPLCTAPEAAVAVHRAPTADHTDWALPSLVAVEIWREGGISAGRLLRLELDVERSRARVCLIDTSDGGADGPPACATTGEVVLDRLPATPDDVAALSGALHAEFPAFPLSASSEPSVMRALVVDARF